MYKRSEPILPNVNPYEPPTENATVDQPGSGKLKPWVQALLTPVVLLAGLVALFLGAAIVGLIIYAVGTAPF